MISPAIGGAPTNKSIGLRGPFASRATFEQGHAEPAVQFAPEEVLSWNDTASLPLLPTEASIDVFAQLRKSPRLDLNDGESWRARPNTELHGTAQKGLMDLESAKCPDGVWPVFNGESFDAWLPASRRGRVANLLGELTFASPVVERRSGSIMRKLSRRPERLLSLLANERQDEGQQQQQGRDQQGQTDATFDEDHRLAA
jgi:hypothetical protein